MSDEIRQWLASEALRLGNEVRDLTKERDGLQEHIKYLEIELKCETGRWERTMEDNARLKAEVERLTNCKSEADRLKAEVERLRKAGDWVMSHWSSGDGSDEVRFCQALLKWHAAKEGKQP